MTETSREQVLGIIEARDIELPEDGLTRQKIRERAVAFRFEPMESFSFRIERHPTMYLSDTGVPGLDASPARFHVLTEYRFDFTDETWRIEELNVTFDYEPWMVIEAELGEFAWTEAMNERIAEVRAADDPEAAFEEVFASLIDHWNDKFDDIGGRKVPREEKAAIIELLVDVLKERAGIG